CREWKGSNGEEVPVREPMADQPTTDPPPGTPGRRALGAMESAVSRARASADAGPTAPVPVPPPVGPRMPCQDRPPDALPALTRIDDGRTPGLHRWLVLAVGAVAPLVVAAAVALIVSLSGGSTTPSLTAARAHPAPTAAPAPSRKQ